MRGLKYVSWGDTTGYAIAAKSYVRALLDAGTPITWVPMMGGPQGYEVQTTRDWPCPKLTTICNKPMDYDTVLIHTVPEYYQDLIVRERFPGRRIFGYTVWELETLPKHWPPILNQLDGVIVPCHWNAQVFRDSGVTVPIHVVPHLSQFEELPATSDGDRAMLMKRLDDKGEWRDRFMFYTIGFWSNRKAPYLALEAYFRAFTADDPVVMVVKTCDKDITCFQRLWRDKFRRRHHSPEKTAAEMAKRYSRPAPYVVIADESLSDSEILALHEMGDCFVSLTRSEGWGLGAFEAARLGKPVVMTGYGGQLDFLAADQAWLVDYEMVPVHEPTWPSSYKPNDLWAEPSVLQAAAHLRSICADPVAAKQRTDRLTARISRDFARAATVESLLSVLQ